jgi:hypothetical protein
MTTGNTVRKLSAADAFIAAAVAAAAAFTLLFASMRMHETTALPGTFGHTMEWKADSCWTKKP